MLHIYAAFVFFVWSLIRHKDEKLQNKNQQLIVEVNKSGSWVYNILYFDFYLFIFLSCRAPSPR